MKKTIILIASLIAIYLLATFICYLEFGTVNVISSVIGIVKLNYLDVQYVQVQNNPKAIFSKKSFDLDNYMKSEGFEKRDQLGGNISYTNGEDIQYVSVSVNKYFTEIIWEREVKVDEIKNDNVFRGTISEINKDKIIVQPNVGESILNQAEEIAIKIQEDIDEFKVGDNLEIKYKGDIPKDTSKVLKVLSIQKISINKYAEMYKEILDDIIMDDESVLEREDELIIVDFNSFNIDEESQKEVEQYMYKYQFKIINNNWDEIKENTEYTSEDGVILDGILLNAYCIKETDDLYSIKLTQYKGPTECFVKSYKLKYEDNVWNYEIVNEEYL